MTFLIQGIMGGLLGLAGTLAGRVLLALGIGFVTFAGVQASVDYLIGITWAKLDGMNGTILGLIALLQVDTTINMLLAAVVARLTLQGLTNGTIRRMVGL